MRFHERGLRLVCVVAGLLALTGAAQAQYKQQNAGQVGNFAILKISEDGGRSVDRCAASMGPGNNMLRFAFGTRNRTHSMSIPGVPGSGLGLMTITLDGRNVFTFQAAGANDQRAWIGLDYGMVDTIMAAKKSIAVNFAGRNFNWSLAGQNMENVFQAISNCVSGTYGAAPAASPPVAMQASPPPPAAARLASPPPPGAMQASPPPVAMQTSPPPAAARQPSPPPAGAMQPSPTPAAARQPSPPPPGAMQPSPPAAMQPSPPPAGAMQPSPPPLAARQPSPPPPGAQQPSPPPGAMQASPPPAAKVAAAPGAEDVGNGVFRIPYTKSGAWEVVRFARDPGGRQIASCSAFRLTGSEQGFHFGYSKAKAEFTYGFMGEGSGMRPSQPVVLWFNDDRADAGPLDATLLADPDGSEWLSFILSAEAPGADDAFKNQKKVSVAYAIEGKPHTESFPLDGVNAVLRMLFDCGNGA
ncbi:hypothetical protein [Ancylobacter terrae]|uniref:hypothetical protein n=1 Tax=Ancylobacter sp. sgz301288 TaxID=3342077 RepID=UPI00385AB9EA